VDFDGDGKQDILSGSWPGELYLFRGLGKGAYAAGQTLRNFAGKPIKLDSASTAFAHDWNGDGHVDLLIGSIQGAVFLMLNEGGTGKPSFKTSQKLAAGAKPISADGGDSHPIAADWDGDGKPDLLVAGGNGGVQWYRNNGSKTAPKLETGRELVKGQATHGPPTAGKRAAMRAKIAVADWNGDGRQDLLLGDFALKQGESSELTAEQKAEQEAAQRKADAAMKKLGPFIEESRKLGSMPTTSAGRKVWQQKQTALRTKYKAEFTELQAAHMAQSRHRPTFTYEGFVWVYLAQPAAAAASR
jgi:hypothetical protein